MGLRIWIDDVKPMPEGYDFWCRWFSEFHSFLRGLSGDRISHVSFDYVLNDDPSWPRPHEKHGDKCVELLAHYPQLWADDLTVEFHSTDPEYNAKMQKTWDEVRKWR